MKNLICVHGFLGSSQDFESFKNYFDNTIQNVQVIALDLSTTIAPFSLKEFASDIYKKICNLKISKATFVGYSMGGRILLELYLEHPEIFEKLILISASPGLSNVEERRKRFLADLSWGEDILAALRSSQPKSFLKKWYAQELFAHFTKTPAFELFLEKRAHTLSDKHAQMVVEASPGGNPPHFDLLGQIQVPVLVLLGEFDQKYQSLWANLIAKPPHFALKIIPNTGHVVHLENPKKTLEAIEEFTK